MDLARALPTCALPTRGDAEEEAEEEQAELECHMHERLETEELGASRAGARIPFLERQRRNPYNVGRVHRNVVPIQASIARHERGRRRRNIDRNSPNLVDHSLDFAGTLQDQITYCDKC